MLARFKSLFARYNLPLEQGLAMALLLSLLAAWAFIVRPSLPRETDAELHVFRAAELGYALRAGVLYPRWAADFYYGYGYPIFHYYAPLTYYLANLLSLTVPGGAVFGVKAVFVVGFVGAGIGVHGLVRRLSGPVGGVIAAASYLFAPYVYLIDPHLRGDLAEFFALAMGPLAFWRLRSWFEERNRRAFVLAALAVAALILTHNLLALVYFAMLVAYTIWEAFTGMGASWRERLGQGMPLAIGLLLAAFFWLPVGLERNAVQLGNLIGPGHFDYRNHFLTLGELMAPAIPLDLGAVNPAFRFNLGVAQWLLALLGVVALVLRPGKEGQRDQLAGVFWLVGLAVLIGLMLPISQPIWDAIPLMAFLQFPWRLLGPALLCTAVLGGFGARLVEAGQVYGVAGLALLPLVLALPIFIPPGWGDFGPTDRLAMLEFELNGLALGTTSTGDFVPVGVDVVPGPNPDLVASYRSGGPIDRVNRRTLPEGASVTILKQGPTGDVLAVNSPEGFILRLYTFMFDGWRASVDGQPVPIETAKPEGFITVAVPAGEHTVRVWLGTTPARTASWVISIVGLGLLVLAAWRLPRRGREAAPAAEPVDFRPLVVGLIVLIGVAGAGYVGEIFQPRSSGLVAKPAQHDLHVYLQGGVDLIGYDLPIREVEPGQEIRLTLYWKAREPVTGNYQVFVHLTSIPEHSWGQSDKLNPGDYPSTRWPLDRYVRDSHRLVVSPGTPPGNYTLRVGLWDHTSGVRQLVLAEDGTILGDSISLPVPITVMPSRRQPTQDELGLDVVLGRELADGLILLGMQREPEGVIDRELELLRLILYWQAESGELADYMVALRVVDESGEVWRRVDQPPTDGFYPMNAWKAEQIVRDVHSLWIDSSLPSGSYIVELGLVTAGYGEPLEWLSLISFERQLPK